MVTNENSWNYISIEQLVLLVCALVVTYPNLRRGRIDRRGLRNGSATVLAISMLVWLLSAEHIVGPGELGVVWLGFASSLLYAGWFALWYCALEPLVRRLWPESLITWTRFVAGRVRDPLVGRDLLIGSLFSVLNSLVGGLVMLAAVWFRGGQADLEGSMPQALQGVSGQVIVNLHILAIGFYLSCFLRYCSHSYVKSCETCYLRPPSS